MSIYCNKSNHSISLKAKQKIFRSAVYTGHYDELETERGETILCLKEISWLIIMLDSILC